MGRHRARAVGNATVLTRAVQPSFAPLAKHYRGLVERSRPWRVNRKGAVEAAVAAALGRERRSSRVLLAEAPVAGLVPAALQLLDGAEGSPTAPRRLPVPRHTLGTVPPRR